MERNQRVADYAVVDDTPRADAQHGQVRTLDVEQLADIRTKLSFLARWEKEPVNDKYKNHRKNKVQYPKLDCRRTVYGKRCKRKRKAGGKDRLNPCAGRTAIHQRDHGCGKKKVSRSTAGQNWKHKKGEKAADRRADKACFHAVGALLIHGLQEQKRIERQPIGVLAVCYAAHHKADRRYEGKPQRKPDLKGIEL